MDAEKKSERASERDLLRRPRLHHPPRHRHPTRLPHRIHLRRQLGEVRLSCAPTYVYVHIRVVSERVLTSVLRHSEIVIRPILLKVGYAPSSIQRTRIGVSAVQTVAWTGSVGYTDAAASGRQAPIRRTYMCNMVAGVGVERFKDEDTDPLQTEKEMNAKTKRWHARRAKSRAWKINHNIRH